MYTRLALQLTHGVNMNYLINFPLAKVILVLVTLALGSLAMQACSTTAVISCDTDAECEDLNPTIEFNQLVKE